MQIELSGIELLALQSIVKKATAPVPWSQRDYRPATYPPKPTAPAPAAQPSSGAFPSSSLQSAPEVCKDEAALVAFFEPMKTRWQVFVDGRQVVWGNGSKMYYYLMRDGVRVTRVYEPA